MSTPIPAPRLAPLSSIDGAIARACESIAPTWPLDRFIAVNPFWGMIDAPLPAVSARLTALSGSRLLMPRAWYREQWRSGRLRTPHLEQAIAERESSTTLAQLLSLLESDEPDLPQRARVMDVVDLERDLGRQMSWREHVTHSTSQFCAAYFDEGQAQLGPEREGGLYASWRRQALRDRSPALLMGLREFQSLARELPATASELASLALLELDVPADEHDAYLTGLLLDLNGWAAWCAYRRWTARLAGDDDHHLEELLAIRLAWEWLLLRSGGRSLASRWTRSMAAWPGIDADARASQADDWLLQQALEIAWQQDVIAQLPAGFDARAASEPAVQAVFCIDVRSEVFRRALEAQSPRIQTLGFAGFFGMPIEYQPIGSTSVRPQLPGLLAARMRVSDCGTDVELAAKRSERLALDTAWAGFKSGPVSTFAFIEAMGVAFAGKLLRDSFGGGAKASDPEHAGLTPQQSATRKPRLTALADGGPVGLEERCALAEGMLRAMSLTRGFARIVALVGHGSTTRNNPHAAGLDCGACCGQSGEVNARAAAALLNEVDVRSGLAQRGIEIPTSTRFVAGLHETTTDDVRLFDLDELPPTHHADAAELQRNLDAASERARVERAPKLGLAGSTPAALHAALRGRSRDWAQVRPEWGLADNAAFIVAPREHSRHLDLEGRSFLHDYRFADDPGFAILKLIMTAPMVVTHWINLQYYASTVDNLRYGSGNKVLHNVVGGHLGVFEGNGGDLRIGLPMQSLHDGEHWVNTPRRLSVFIEAPRAAIDAIVAEHAGVRALVDNEWLYLFELDAEQRTIHARRRGEWVDVTAR